MKRIGLLLMALGLFLFAQAAQAQWTLAKRITWTSGESYNPIIAVCSNSNIHVVWEDYTPGYPEIYYMKSMSGGAFLNQSIRLTWTLGDSHNPALATDADNAVYVVWYDNTPGNFEIYYKKRH